MLGIPLRISQRPRTLSLLAPLAAASAVLGLGAGLAQAQAAGNDFAGPTDADGASAFWNPAALSQSVGTRLEFTGNFSYLRITYDHPDNPGSSTTKIPKPQPILGGYTDILGDKWRLGFTLGVPYTSGAKWDRNGAEGSITRYYGADAVLLHALLTPAISYRLSDHVSVGFGVNFDYGYMKAEFDKDFAAQLNGAVGGSTDSPFTAGTPELAAPVNIAMSGFGIGAVGGVLLQPSDRVKFGAALHSPIRAKISGDLGVAYPEAMTEFVSAVAPGAELPDIAGNVTLDFRLPIALFTALSVRATRNWDLRIDYRFVNFAATTNSDILISQTTNPDLKPAKLASGRSNRHSLGLRAIRTIADGKGKLALRLRLENSNAAERSFTPTNMDFKKLELGMAGQWRVTQRVVLAAQYSKFVLAPMTVRSSLHRQLADANLDAYNHPAPLGTYSIAVDMFSLGITVDL